MSTLIVFFLVVGGGALLVAMIFSLIDPWMDGDDFFGVWLGAMCVIAVLFLFFAVLRGCGGVEAGEPEANAIRSSGAEAGQSVAEKTPPPEVTVEPYRPQEVFEFGNAGDFGPRAVEARNFGGEK